MHLDVDPSTEWPFAQGRDRVYGRRVKGFAAIAAGLTIVALWLPTTASASVVRDMVLGIEVSGTAGADVVSLTQRGRLADLTIADPAGVQVARPRGSAGMRCVALAATVVRCHDLSSVKVDLGAGDDRLTSRRIPPAPSLVIYELRGGAGADRIEVTGAAQGASTSLYGGPGDDVLVGGPGQESLNGGVGRDQLRGGAGDDGLGDEDRSGAADSDSMDGGPGRDAVGYNARRAPVDVDLQRVTGNGESGEGDIITNVEDLRGGRAADVLAGTQQANRIDGDASDQIFARGGNDSVSVETERGHGGILDLGAGNDEASVDVYHTIDVGCGIGRDVVRMAGSTNFRGPGPLLRRSCERLQFGVEYGNPKTDGWDPIARRWRRGGRLAFRLPCSGGEEIPEPRCRGELVLTSPRFPFRRVASSRFRGRSHDAIRVVVAPPRRIVAAARHRRVEVLLRLKVQGSEIVRWRIRLPLRR
jgi:hypothetical protein